ncbi:MAG: hypothetical protein IPN78_18430 [Candidatus Accumulibacter sp.]|nr:hypothetical protein [Candidatus Accumulibacter propinquus]
MNFSTSIASIAAFSLLTATSVEAVPAGTLYGAFHYSCSLARPRSAHRNRGHPSARATHLVAAGDHVFWQDDIRIWRANKDLSGVTQHLDQPACAGRHQRHPTSTYLFEAFPQLFTLDLRTLHRNR